MVENWIQMGWLSQTSEAKETLQKRAGKFVRTETAEKSSSNKCFWT